MNSIFRKVLSATLLFYLAPFSLAATESSPRTGRVTLQKARMMKRGLSSVAADWKSKVWWQVSPQKSTSASWSQSGNTVTFSGSGMPSDSVHNIAYFGCPATDSDLEVVVNFQGDIAGIIMRASPAAPGGEDHFYMCRLDSRPSGTTGISIIKSSDENPHYPGWPFGWPRQIEWGKKPADAKHTDVRLRMSCTGNQIRCYKDGVLMVSATDSSLASGVYGLATWSWPQDKDSSATFTIVTQA